MAPMRAAFVFFSESDTSSVVGFTLDSFQNNGDSLPDADAHGAPRVASARSTQLMYHSRDQPCAPRTQWMTDGDCATVWVHVRGVVRYTEMARHGECPGVDGLVRCGHI